MKKQKGYVDLFAALFIALILGFILWVIYVVFEEIHEQKERQKVLETLGPDAVVIRQRHVGNTEDGCKVFSLYDLKGYAYRISCPQSEVIYTDIGGKTPVHTSVTSNKK